MLRFKPHALWGALLLPIFLITTQSAHAAVIGSESAHIAQLIFQNECASKDSCLTSWNAGEEFASLGIGHFIWYPAHTEKIFKESFPALIAFMQQQGETSPAWLFAAPQQANPWPDRQSFMHALHTAKMQSLRKFLIASKAQQAAFMQQRFQASLPLLLRGLNASDATHVRQQFAYVAASPMGIYALMDYVNFKGEGTSLKERYHGKGWGLLQVLQQMHVQQTGVSAIASFSHAADLMLTRRVRLSPAARHEQRWLPGWRKRLTTYVQEANKAVAQHAENQEHRTVFASIHGSVF